MAAGDMTHSTCEKRGLRRFAPSTNGRATAMVWAERGLPGSTVLAYTGVPAEEKQTGARRESCAALFLPAAPFSLPSS